MDTPQAADAADARVKAITRHCWTCISPVTQRAVLDVEGTPQAADAAENSCEAAQSAQPAASASAVLPNAQRAPKRLYIIADTSEPVPAPRPVYIA